MIVYFAFSLLTLKRSSALFQCLYLMWNVTNHAILFSPLLYDTLLPHCHPIAYLFLNIPHACKTNPNVLAHCLHSQYLLSSLAVPLYYLTLPVPGSPLLCCALLCHALLCPALMHLSTPIISSRSCSLVVFPCPDGLRARDVRRRRVVLGGKGK